MCAVTRTVLVDALGHLADSDRRRLGRHELDVAARRAVAEADWAELADLDDDVLLEGGEEGQVVFAVALEQPASPRRCFRRRVEQAPFCVPTHEARGKLEARNERERLGGQRPPGQVTAEDDELGGFGANLREDSLQRDGVGVDVGEHRDAVDARARGHATDATPRQRLC